MIESRNWRDNTSLCCYNTLPITRAVSVRSEGRGRYCPNDGGTSVSRQTLVCSTTILAVTIACSSASASPVADRNLEVQITGLNLVYDGTNIFDAGSSNQGSGGNPLEADPLTSMSFLLDGNLVGSVLTSNIFADLFIKDVTGIPVGGGLVTSGGNGDAFGVDLLTKPTTPARGLGLDIDAFQVFYSGSGITIATTGLATDVATQDLPFNLSFFEDQPIAIVFSSSNLRNLTDDGTFVTGFTAAGTGNVSGTGVPEPATVALLGIGLLALGRRVTRRAR